MAVGAGVAGTMNPPLREWLHDALTSVLPNTPIYTTHDLEIALIGAHGERRGVIIVAGTGSAAYGVNDAGESLLVGGWGYLLGDEGGGAWIGLQALKKVIAFADEGETLPLAERIFDLLQISEARQLVEIIYQPGVPVAPRLARFAPFILKWAEDDSTASGIIYSAATRLHYLFRRLQRRLNLTNPPIAFSGGLLNEPNSLSLGLQQQLNLPVFPKAKYPPEIGAALYAMEQLRKSPP